MIRIHDRETLFEEAAFVAYHLGWSHDAVLELPHWERKQWCEQISAINERVNGGQPTAPAGEGSTGILDDHEGGTVLRNSLDGL